jgi:hypothetical protein
VAEKGKLNIGLMSDLVHTINFFCQGRLMQRGKLIGKDVLNCAKVTETLGQMIFAHRNSIQEKCQKLKERMLAIKSVIKENPLGIVKILEDSTGSGEACSCGDGKDGSCLSKHFATSFSNVTIYLLNIFTHVGLSAAPHQIQTLSPSQRV